MEKCLWMCRCQWKQPPFNIWCMMIIINEKNILFHPKIFVEWTVQMNHCFCLHLFRTRFLITFWWIRVMSICFIKCHMVIVSIYRKSAIFYRKLELSHVILCDRFQRQASAIKCHIQWFIQLRSNLAISVCLQICYHLISWMCRKKYFYTFSKIRVWPHIN